MNNSKYSNVRVGYKLWMTGDDGNLIIDDYQFQLLKEIETTGSLMEATNKVGVSYRKAWGDLKNCEQSLGFPLLEKQRGGQEGGHTSLTEEGIRLIRAYEKLHERFQNEVNEVIIDFKRTIKGKK